MSIVSEFKEFAVKGNMVDMAVGIIIGGAFGKIVSSLVADVIMPLLGVVIGGVDFSALAVTLKDKTATAEPVLLKYGVFLQAAFDFLIVAMAIFMVIKAINSMKRKEEEEAEEAGPSKEEELLTEIRDLLSNK